MDTQNIFIKNMVCHRCEIVVQSIVDDLGLPVSWVQMGEVLFAQALDDAQFSAFESQLKQVGFEVVQSRREQLVEQITVEILHYMNNGLALENLRMSEYLSARLGYEYRYLSSLFSSAKEMSIERFAIVKRVEMIKELMFVDNLSLSQIASQLGYSSPAHMSNQFKKETGYSPGAYRRQYSNSSRVSIDHLNIV